MILLSWYLIGNVPFLLNLGQERESGRVKLPNCEYLLLASSGESTFETQLEK